LSNSEIRDGLTFVSQEWAVPIVEADVLAIGALNCRTIGPFTPKGAWWMWTTVAGSCKPDTLTLTHTVMLRPFTVTLAVPNPVVIVGGT
jgi:hypothetical protein